MKPNINPKDGVPNTSKTLQQHFQTTAKIPPIQHTQNFTTRAQGYTHGIIVRFESKQAGDDYQTHELHVTVLGLLKKALDTDNGPPVLAMDYEVL